MEDSTTTRTESGSNRLPPPSRDPVSRELSPVRQAIAERQMFGRSVTAATDTPTPAPNLDWATRPIGQPDWPFANATIVSGASQTGATQTPLYGDDDPFRIAADIFSRMFASNPIESPQEPVVVGDASFGSSSSGNGKLLVLLVVIGGIGYFLYKRYGT